MNYNISQDAFQAKHRPLTPNIIETVAFFTHPYAFILIIIAHRKIVYMTYNISRYN